MPRRARHYIPQLPYHLIQRGNNREPCFVEPENYRFYLALWQELSERYGLAAHAYCLMTNHIHFLVTPASENAISFVMKNVGSRYAQYFNKRYKRTGTLCDIRGQFTYFPQFCFYLNLRPLKKSGPSLINR